MRFSHSSRAVSWDRLSAAMSPGIYPYLGGSIDADQLRTVVARCGGAVVPGKSGVKLAAKVPGVMVDPAQYDVSAKSASDGLFDFDEWLERQRSAGVPVVLTDTPRIRNRDRSALRKALARWEMIDEPAVVVLPLESWWLRDGLSCLTEEVRAAGRPVAVVLLHHYNGLDAAGAIAGLLEFVSAIDGLPVMLLRCDVSAIGAAAHGAFAGFVGWSASTRHGPMPMRSKEGDGERDESPPVFVPALHDYFKASRFPAFARGRDRDILRCDDPTCRGESLLQIARLSEVDPAAARLKAYHHNLAITEQIAQRILTSRDPRDAWWESCEAGAETAITLIEDGIALSVSRWLRQWLEMGSPAHDPESVR
jgi:hypothetical protein